MLHTITLTPKRSLAALGAGAALTLALTGCLPSTGPANGEGSTPAEQEQSATATAAADKKEATHETKVTKVVQGSEAGPAVLEDSSAFAGQVSPPYLRTVR